jgi:hypothetical protein
MMVFLSRTYPPLPTLEGSKKRWLLILMVIPDLIPNADGCQTNA